MNFNVCGKRVTIIGAARSGIAAANAVCRLGGRAKISEFRPYDQAAQELKLLESPGDVLVECGGHTRAFIEDSDYVVVSPGVRQDMPPVLFARASGIEVMGEVEFAYRLCPCPVVAVTGSNGKTTTVTLIAAILQQAGKNVCLCGNIGSPFSKHVLDLKSEDIVVLEISSFQLESTRHFRPHVAVWLNFSQNHLDRHKDLEEYFSAKKKIFLNQKSSDVAILNFTQEEFKDLANTLAAKVVFFNTPRDPKDINNPNYLAAMAAAEVFGVTEDFCRGVFAGFKGVEHRQEFVRTIDGVDYINDSKSTTVEAGRWALTHITKPLVMICGGSDKHSDFAPIKELVGKKVKHMVLIGQTKEILHRTFTDVVPVTICVSLKEAVDAARLLARPGDAVALSPMCASFDMFKDYEHRGRCFKEIVSQLT